MSCGVSASPSPPNCCSPPLTPETSRYFSASCSLIPPTLSSTDLKLRGLRFSGAKGPQTIRICCNSSTRPGGPGSGDTDNRSVLDAFFLGKALAEALSERIESSVGEFLSTIGRLQAEQQKQVQDFQEDVLERAKRAKEKAALEAIEAHGRVSKATTENTTPATDAVNSVTSPSVTSEIAPATPSVQSDPDAAEKEELRD